MSEWTPFPENKPKGHLPCIVTHIDRPYSVFPASYYPVYKGFLLEGEKGTDKPMLAVTHYIEIPQPPGIKS